MAEYIERESVEKFIMDGLNNSDVYERFGHDAIKIIAEVHYMPAADVAPVRHGRWLYGDYYDIGDVCSECDWDSKMTHPSYRYCPNCGAKMDRGTENATD